MRTAIFVWKSGISAFSVADRPIGGDGGGAGPIRVLIESKNYAGLSDELDRLPSNKAVDAIRRLPRLFGGAEILEEAESLCSGGETREILRYLAGLYRSLQALGLEKQVDD